MSTLFAGPRPPELAAEAEARWGQTEAWATAQRRTARYDAATWERLRAEVQAIEAGFIALLTQGAPAEGPEAVALAEAHRAHISRWFYPCSLELHLGLGELYTADPRKRADAAHIPVVTEVTAEIEAMGGEASRLRPRLTIANFKRWTNSELDLRREAASVGIATVIVVTITVLLALEVHA